jgi:hypothetical protein
MIGGVSPQLTADLVARAIIAAALSYGLDPVHVAENPGGAGERRALNAAVSGLYEGSGSGFTIPRLAAILGLSRQAIYEARAGRGGPFRRASMCAEDVVRYQLRIAEQLDGAQAAAFAATLSPPVAELVAEPEVLDLGEVGDLPDPWPALDQLVNVATEELDTLRRRRALQDDLDARLAERLVSGSRPSPYSPAAGRPAPADPPRPRPPLRDARRKAPRGAIIERRGGGVEVIRLKPVTDSIARHAKAQIEQGLDVSEAADLFDVDVDQLDRAVKALGR